MARVLTKKSYEKWRRASAEVPKYITELYEKKMPPEIKAMFNKYPSYFSTSSTVYPKGPGLGYNTHESATKQLPKNTGGGNSCTIELTAEEAETLKALMNAREDAKKYMDDLVRETTNSILALGTSKRVAEHFPQAANLLPETPAKTLALIPNLEGLTKKLKNQ